MFIEVTEVYRAGSEYKTRLRTLRTNHIISFYSDQITTSESPLTRIEGTMMSIMGRGAALPLSNGYDWVKQQVQSKSDP